KELGLKQIEWRPYVPEGEVRSSLLEADCLVVTQKTEVCGMLWPSKLALMLSLPRQILFVGPVDGDIARSLRDLGHTGIFAPGDCEGIASWFIDIKRDTDTTPALAIDAAEHRAESLAKWVELVEACDSKAAARATSSNPSESAKT